MADSRIISVAEISRHDSPSDIWIVVDGRVYDVTDFAPSHPGGPSIILKHAGRDATRAYDEIHAPSLISDTLPLEKQLGTVDASTVTAEWARPPPGETKQPAVKGEKPSLHSIINSYDFEAVAEQTISKKAWAFYSSAATDLITRDANKSFYDKIWLRPRILTDVRWASTKTRILGCESEAPFMVAPAAVAKLVHPEGEKALARGAAARGIFQCVSSNASFPLREIVPAAPSGYPFFFQLYVNSDRPKSEALLREVTALGVRAIFLTVDAPLAGKREADERVVADASVSAPMTGGTAGNDEKGGGMGRLMGTYIDASLSWADLAWLRRCTDLPIVLKGVQTAQDARLAMEHGVQGIVLSNHGGRSLDTSSPAVLVLLELRRCCPEVFDSMEVFVDGGIRRGTDILKAVCLGATAVGLGRPFLYALNYGEEGVTHLVDILKDELETSMKMVGITDLGQAHPGLLNTADLDHLVPRAEGPPYALGRAKARL
ncbi:MAG: hypothetical protein M1832_000092 [Thelocarpon impressellum]|nr:MAG: hypothetical protein M1832_000092 [Thelocarpon impressellum]